MNLIDRYIYVATEHLPEDIKEDVNRELRANIEDMLPDNPTEEDIYKVLEKLGSPKKLSSEYSQRKRYLIGPDLYEQYISVLKLVAGITVTVCICITLLSWFLKPAAEVEAASIFVRIISDTISAAIQGLTQGALWVTIIFAIIERTGVIEGKLPFVKKKWSPNDLKSVQIVRKRNISRGETLFSMFSNVLFVSMLYFQPQLIGIYYKADKGLTQATPLLEVERLQIYMPVILIVAVISLSILVWKYLSRHWSIPLAIANTINNIAVSVLLSTMLTDKSLLNPKFTSSLADLINISAAKMSDELLKFSLVFISIFILICAYDSVSGFIKSRK